MRRLWVCYCTTHLEPVGLGAQRMQGLDVTILRRLVVARLIARHLHCIPVSVIMAAEPGNGTCPAGTEVWLQDHSETCTLDSP